MKVNINRTPKQIATFIAKQKNQNVLRLINNLNPIKQIKENNKKMDGILQSALRKYFKYAYWCW